MLVGPKYPNSRRRRSCLGFRCLSTVVVFRENSEPIEAVKDGGLKMTESTLQDIGRDGPRPQFESYVVTGTSWPKAEVAGLSTGQLVSMSDRELVQVIRSVHQPHRRADLRGPLGGLAREPLVDLAQQARRYCRAQGY